MDLMEMLQALFNGESLTFEQGIDQPYNKNRSVLERLKGYLCCFNFNKMGYF